MNLKSTLIVYRKELKDVLRDRRTVLSMVLFPLILMPLLSVGMGYFMKERIESIREKVASVGWIAPDDAWELTTLVSGDDGIMLMTQVDDSALVIELLRHKDLDAVVIIPETFMSELHSITQEGNGSEEAPQIQVFADDTREKSGFAVTKIISHLQGYRNDLVRESLTARGMPPELVRPYVIMRQNVASPKEMGLRFLGSILPYIIILMALTGAMYPAIDLTAGEKERGTLETLFVSAVSRLDIVAGKFLTVFTASIVTAVLSLGSITLTGMGLLGMDEAVAAKLNFSIEPRAVIILFIAMIPLSAIFSALLMTIAIFARSYKEAQSYISPLMIVVFLPAMASLLPDVEFSRQMALIPIVNVSILIKEGLMGVVDPTLVALTMAVNLTLAAICLFLVVRMFRKESVLFKI